MKKITTASEVLWDITFRLSEGEKIDISKMSQKEQKEISENLAVIQELKNMDEITPSKNSFEKMLQQVSSTKTHTRGIDWKSFFTAFGKHKSSWTLTPVLGALLIGVYLWGPQQQQVNLILAEAETLSEEIQTDFTETAQELQELEDLKKLFTQIDTNTSSKTF